jgi:hypothetical protein
MDVIKRIAPLEQSNNLIEITQKKLNLKEKPRSN